MFEICYSFVNLDTYFLHGAYYLPNILPKLLFGNLYVYIWFQETQAVWLLGTYTCFYSAVGDTNEWYSCLLYSKHFNLLWRIMQMWLVMGARVFWTAIRSYIYTCKKFPNVPIIIMCTKGPGSFPVLKTFTKYSIYLFQ